MYCTINLGPYGDVWTYVLDFFEFSHMLKENLLMFVFRTLVQLATDNMQIIESLQNYIPTQQRNKMVTAIKNRLSRMFYAFIHKTKDLCSAY